MLLENTKKTCITKPHQFSDFTVNTSVKTIIQKTPLVSLVPVSLVLVYIAHTQNFPEN